MKGYFTSHVFNHLVPRLKLCSSWNMYGPTIFLHPSFFRPFLCDSQTWRGFHIYWEVHNLGDAWNDFSTKYRWQTSLVTWLVLCLFMFASFRKFRASSSYWKRADCDVGGHKLSLSLCPINGRSDFAIRFALKFCHSNLLYHVYLWLESWRVLAHDAAVDQNINPKCCCILN